MEPLYFRNLNLYSQQNISDLQCLKYFTLFKKKLVPIKHLSLLWGVWPTHFTDIIITEAAHFIFSFLQIIPLSIQSNKHGHGGVSGYLLTRPSPWRRPSCRSYHTCCRGSFCPHPGRHATTHRSKVKLWGKKTNKKTHYKYTV